MDNSVDVYRFNESGEPPTARFSRSVEQLDTIFPGGDFDECVGSGDVGDVFTDTDLPGLEAHTVLKRYSRADTSGLRLSPEREMMMQGRAHLLLKQEAQNRPCALVPQPLMFFARESPSELFVFMEKVQGKTLYRCILEETIKNQPELWQEKYVWDDIAEMTDESIAYMLYRDAHAIAGREITKRCLARLSTQAFLPPLLLEQLTSALDTFNRESFFHRDLHEKNIMITNDHSQLYIIDFDVSAYGISPEDARTTTNHLTGTVHSFVPDTAILDILRPCIATPLSSKTPERG